MGRKRHAVGPLRPEQSDDSEPGRKEAQESSEAKSPATTFSANPE
jgi:hypothetical protein